MIKLIRPPITFEEIESELREVFASGQLTRGPHNETFRNEIKRVTGAKHCFLTTSATTALSACLQLLSVGPGDEVLVSDFSFPATANVVENRGAVPRFVDVNRKTYNMAPSELERRIRERRPKAVIFVDALGNPSGIGEIAEICRRYQVPLIEDAACALGSHERNVSCGAIADLTCFSFHPRKIITTGEGGAITTGSDAFADVLKTLLNHGSVETAAGFDFVASGFNYRMSELQAVMGIAQIRRLPEIIAARREIAARYNEALVPLGFVPQAVEANAFHNVQSLCFTVPPGASAAGLRAYLKDKGVETTLGTYAISHTVFYSERYHDGQPVARWLQDNTVTFPCFDGLECGVVFSAVQSFFDERLGKVI